MAIAAMMPMIATTISSSIRVKPFCFFISLFVLSMPPFAVAAPFWSNSRAGGQRNLSALLSMSRRPDLSRRHDKNCHAGRFLSATDGCFLSR